MKNLIAKFRNKMGVNQEDFAEMIGITRPHLSQIENNKVPNLSGSLMFKIANEFGEPVESIFFMDVGRNTEQKVKSFSKTG